MLKLNRSVIRVLCVLLASVVTRADSTVTEVLQTIPTQGEAWPAPQVEKKLDTFFTFMPSQFNFKAINQECELLEKAILRYTLILKTLYNITLKNRKVLTSGKWRTLTLLRRKREPQERNYGALRVVQLNLTEPCEDYPSFGMDESYFLRITNDGAVLKSDSIWGMLRGMETLAQLFYLSESYTEIRINCTDIYDFPLYAHRGLLLDTSRHYISVKNILQTLDAMAMNKMNVFHWHIVDDQSFPYQSTRFPELSEEGAYFPTLVYTRTNVESIVEYARERGIRVIPEFDVPGHTRSWGLSHPNILTECKERAGPLHPLRKATYKLLQHLFREAQVLFPDKYFHVGGDEVDTDCWKSNPDIKRFMTKSKFSDINEVTVMFMSKVFRLLGNRSTPIVWQEAYDAGLRLPQEGIVQVWQPGWKPKVTQMVKDNINVVLSTPWYLDHLNLNFLDFHKVDPRREVSRHVRNDLLTKIVGGEACMWGEQVNDCNIHVKIWPRASAVAEVLWGAGAGAGAGAGGDSEHLLQRVEEHACRMRRRGLRVAPPTGPGFYVVRPTKGAVWPEPQGQRDKDEVYLFSPLFEFQIANETCAILKKAVSRYYGEMIDFYHLVEKYGLRMSELPRANDNVTADGEILELKLLLKQPCEDEYPHFKMDESYTLKVSANSVLIADTVWGMLRGLETFSQLFYMTNDYSEIRINGTDIMDFPHYLHRGLLLDTSRHYISVRNILQTLDAMAVNKMNVFHWHIVDDQSFPFRSQMFPELSEKGAFHPSMVYTREDIQQIVEHARYRGIRVIPEIDVPGHTASWGASHPELQTDCYKYYDELSMQQLPASKGPLNPFKRNVYKMLAQLFGEVQDLFPDDYLHIGGDEVDLGCWASNPEIRSIMMKHNITEARTLFALFSKRAIDLIGNVSKPIVWEDVYFTGTNIPEYTMVQTWNADNERLASLVKDEVNVIFSTGWHLEQQEFEELYRIEPRTRLGRHRVRVDEAYIVGGEACLWTDHVDDTNIHSRIWPRASAVAEVLWSVTGAGAGAGAGRMRSRLAEHVCRMLRRGIPTEPITGPSFCLTP